MNYVAVYCILSLMLFSVAIFKLQYSPWFFLLMITLDIFFLSYMRVQQKTILRE
jgi:uncharacterized membrane protein